MCDWRKLPRRVTSRPEIEISDKRLAFSSQTSSIEPSYKTGPKQVKMSISPIAQGFLKKFRVQNVALTARRPKHPCLAWCTPLFLYETFSRLIPRDSNKGHHRYGRTQPARVDGLLRQSAHGGDARVGFSWEWFQVQIS
jgi:hypothetical protein